MGLAGLILLNVLFLLGGSALLWAARGWKDWVEWLALSGVAYMSGLGATAVVMTLVLVAGGPVSTGAVLAVVFGMVGASAAVALRLRRPLPRRGTLPQPTSPAGYLAAVLASLDVALLVAWFRAARVAPLTTWDAWSFWVPKAKTIYFFGGIDNHLFTSFTAGSYPLLVPTLDAMDFRFAGSADTILLAVQYWLLLVGFLGAMWGLLRKLAPPWLVALFAALVLVLPELDIRLLTRIGDWPLDFFFCLGALAVLRWTMTRERWSLLGAGVFLAAMLATKREGQLLAACLVVGGIASLGWRRRHAWLPLVATAACAYAVNIPWRLWWTSRHLASDTPDGGILGSTFHLARVPASFELVFRLLFDYGMWSVAVPVAIAAAALVVMRVERQSGVFFLAVSALGVVGWAWVNWTDPSLPITTQPALNPTPRAVGSLALLAVATAPVLLARALAIAPAAAGVAAEPTLPRIDRRVVADLLAQLQTVRPRYVLGAVVVAQWLTVLGLAVTVRHAGWIFYQGGDQLWYYTIGWLFAHGQLGVAGVGYLWSSLLAPIAAVTGPNVLDAYPALVLLDALVLLPLGTFCIFGIANRIAGRLFGYWTAVLWLVLPFAGILYTNAGYHQRYTELFLPQAFGLTGLADFPALVAVLVSGYFVARLLFDERPDLLDAVAAGLAAGAAFAIKPSAALFLAGPALALLGTRRFRMAGAMAAALLPAIVTLALWKWRSLGHLPIASAYDTARVAADSVGLPLGLGLHRYFNFDWHHLSLELANLREYFWSARLVEWTPFAGVIALWRRAPRAALLAGGWFAAFVVVKGTWDNASLSDGSLMRIMIPAFPAFVLLAAAIPLLLPPLLRRAGTAAVPGPRPLTARSRLGLVGAGLAVTALVPFVAIAAASPQSTASPATASFQYGSDLNPPIPANVDLGLRANVRNGAVSLLWRSASAAGRPVFYRVFRGPAATADFSCDTSTRVARCRVELGDVGTATTPELVDKPGRGTWRYRIGVAANWLDDPSYGDVYELSRSVAVTVP